MSATHLAEHDADLQVDISSFSRQEQLDFQKAATREPRRLRRSKVYNPRPANGNVNAANGGKIGGYRSNITPEKFRKGRAEEAQVNETESYDDLHRGDVEDGDLLISIDEGGVTAAPWARKRKSVRS